MNYRPPRRRRKHWAQPNFTDMNELGNRLPILLGACVLLVLIVFAMIALWQGVRL